MRRKREIKKDHIRSFVYLNSIDSVLLNSRIEHVMTTKGRTMSKVVYVRECPLYSVFWNVSIKCYILCTLVLHFITHTREIMRRESEVATSLLNIDWSRFKFERNYKIPCLSNVLLFNFESFGLVSKQNLVVTLDVPTFVAWRKKMNGELLDI